MKVRIKPIYSGTRLPDGSELMNVYACLNRNELILPGDRKVIPCGFAIDIPKGYCMLLLPRAGLSVKHGITIHNTPSAVPPGYFGEVRVILQNDGDAPFEVFHGATIAQAVILPVPVIEWDSTQEIYHEHKV